MRRRMLPAAMAAVLYLACAVLWQEQPRLEESPMDLLVFTPSDGFVGNEEKPA